MSARQARHIVYVLSQQTGGPVDLTVGLALELAGREGGPKVTVIGPEPITSAGELGPLWQPMELPSKFNVRSGRKLRMALAALGPDVVHAQDRRSGLMTTRAVAGALRVTTYHGVPEDVPAAWAAGRGGRRPSARSLAVLAADGVLARASDRVFAPSAAIGRLLVRQLHVPPRRVEVLPNGVRLPVQRPPLHEVRTVLFVGALVPRKAVDVVISAFARVRQTSPHLRLRIVGDGPERSRLQEQARALGVGDTEFVGYRRDVPEQLVQGDVFMLASLNENQPLALLEAMGAGLACIATDVGGTAEVMPTGLGLLVAPGDVDGMARALASLVESPAAAADMARRGAEAARSIYSVAACADRHLAAYSRLLDDRQPEPDRDG